MSPRPHRVGLTGARFGRVTRDDEPAPTPPHTDPPATQEPVPPAARAPADDVDDHAEDTPVGARFARRSRTSHKHRRADAGAASEASTEASGARREGTPPTPGTTPPVPAWPEPAGAVPEPEPAVVAGTEPVRVRPYVHTGGRTRARLPLPMESLVTALPGAGASTARLGGVHQAVMELCQITQSVAEVSARLAVPLGVARVLVADLVAQGLVTVHGEVITSVPDMALMNRVLAGLRRL